MRRISFLCFTACCLWIYSTSAVAVINGQFLNGPDFHWVVRVYNSEGSCSGALLNSQWVLTEGQCAGVNLKVEVIDYPAEFDFERLQDSEELSRQYGVATWSEHSPRFVLATRDVERVHFKHGSDVALLKVKHPFENVKEFAPVATAAEVKLLENKTYIPLIAAGFGLNGRVGSSLQETPFGLLKYYYFTALDRSSFRLNFFSPSNAYETYPGVKPSLYDAEPSEGLTAMAAQGDNGGPLLAELGGVWKIIGVHVISGGRLPYRHLLVPGWTLKMPRKVLHVKVDQSFLCSLLLQTGGDRQDPGASCQ